MELTTEQRDLRDAVRGLLSRPPAAAARAPVPPDQEPPDQGPPGREPGPGYDRALWQRLCGEIGVAGLAIPQCYGGAGAGPVETHVVMEELGRTLTPSPLLGSAVLAAQALLASGDAAACERLLPGIADGTAVAALAWTGEAGHWDPAEVACDARPAPAGSPPDGTPPDGTPPDGTPPDGTPADGTPAGGSRSGAVLLAGEAHHVLDGDTADVLLAAAHAPGGAGLFEVDPRHAGVTRRAVTTMDTTRRLAVIGLDGVPGQPAGGRSGRDALAQARDLALIALSAEQVGAAQHALAATVAYSKVRVQFGQPIGAFQALQHRMADLHVLVESARSLSYAAAEAAAQGAADLGLRAAAAKAYCSEVLSTVAGQMIQLHGAIGVTWEHDAHRYFKRAHGSAQLFGQPSAHVARIAAAVVRA